MSHRNEVDDLQIGKVGEYLVCADLILKGHVAYPSEQGLAYDVVADVDGKLIRIQVKTTRGPVQKEEDFSTFVYVFNVRRCGKGGRKRLTEKDTDLIALVALDSGIIGYLPVGQATTCMSFRVEALRDQYGDVVNEKKRALICSLSTEGFSGAEIGRRLKLHKSYVCRVIRGEIPIKSVYNDRKRFLSDWPWEEVLNDK